MASSNPKEQIIDRLKDVDNVLITVNANPSVDELAAALGITLVLDKLEKHATAVFSGAIPEAINFLKPEQTFEGTVDSLRDFIIALDKEKADHLRYKVEGDMVKIFITPYKTTITDKDLDFSQGDYNVEMVIAIGVKEADDLDKSLEDHGRIMHDATVATISISERDSSLGSIHWYEGGASSYSEVITSLAQDLRKDKSLIDEQVANAFLTGIVASTDRFSNQKTTSESMTVAAQLMAAGANQQLIVAKLEEAVEEVIDDHSSKDDNKAARLDEDDRTKIDRGAKTEEPAKEDKQSTDDGADGSLVISHTKRGDVDEVAERVASDSQSEAAKKAEQELEDSLASAKPDLEKNQTPIADQINEATEDEVGPSHQEPEASLPPPAINKPSLGGTLNATSEEAAAAKRSEMESDRNKVIMSHGQPLEYVGNPPASVTTSPFTATHQQNNDEPPTVDPFVEPARANEPMVPQSKARDLQPITPDAPAPDAQPSDQQQPQMPSLPPAPVATSTPLPQVDEAKAAVEAAIQAGPPSPAPEAQSPSMPPLPPMPDFTAGNLPPLPPMPTDFSQLPPLPGTQSNDPAPEQRLEDIIAAPSGVASTPDQQDPQPIAPNPPSDPNQFQIPS